MDVLTNLGMGFAIAFSPINIGYCFLGVVLGTAIGVLPGVGPIVTISVLLPITFGLPPEASVIMLAGIYYGAAYGGSTTSILLNLPGEAASVVTCIDGHQMARQGKAGLALSIAAIGSFFAGCFGTVLIALFAKPLSNLALDFGPAEYFSVMLMALVLTAALGHGSLLKGVTMGLLGVLFGLAGTDVNSGVQRFTFGMPGLAEGVDFVVVAMGLFALTEIITSLESHDENRKTTIAVTSLWPSFADLRSSAGAMLRGTVVGSLLGVLPGAGQTISSFSAYILEKRISRTPERFGAGAIEGVASPESANNAAAQTSFIPTLTLGVPGSATMALFIGALMIHGIAPGPTLITEHADLFWGLIASMWIGNALLVLLNLPLVGIWVRILKIPYRWLYPAILMFACVGIFSTRGATLDILLSAGIGLLGYVFAKLDCTPAPFILGFVLGPMIEENFRRALLLSRGDPLTFFEYPISAAFLVVTIVLFLTMILPAFQRSKERAIQE